MEVDMFKIIKKENLAPNIFLMDVEAPRIAKYALPGQFLIVRVDEEGERIPLTICDYDSEKGIVQIVFQVIGGDTYRMSHLEVGDSFADMVGPLGKPSDLTELPIEELKKMKICFIAGGVRKKRTAANVRSAFTKGGGSIGTPGCVSFMFDKKGQIIVDKEECDLSADDLMMIVLDAGAEDIKEEEDSFEIITAEEDFDAVEKALKDEGIALASSEVTMIPQNYVKVTDETMLKQINRILDILDDDDDVQNVYHNWDED